MRLRSVAVALVLPVASLLAQSEWTVGSKPQLDMSGGGANGKINFQNLGGATMLRNGSLLVVDRGEMSIKLIDATGRVVKTIGRQGRGPGEYPFIVGGWGCGQDSMLVWSPVMGGRMLGPDGNIAREFKIPADSARLAPLTSVDCSTGSLLYLSQPVGRPTTPTADGMFSLMSNVMVVSRDGAILRRVDSIPSGEWMATPPGGAFLRPMGPTTSVAAVDGRIVIGFSDSSRVWVVQPDGKRSSLAVPGTRRAPTKEEFDAAVAASASMAPVAVRPRVEPIIAKAPVPKLLPAYSGLYGDREGLLWVQQSPQGAAQTTYTVMRLDGRVAAHVIVPVPFSIYEIGRDYILGTYSDANDEEHVAVFKLTRR